MEEGGSSGPLDKFQAQFNQRLQVFLDRSTPHTNARWIGALGLLILYFVRVYLISGFRWSFYENADVPVGLSLGITAGFLVACLVVIRWMFRTGYRLRA